MAGKWILTAAHCSGDGGSYVEFANHDSLPTKNKINHPDYMSDGVDVALWELPSLANTVAISFLSMRNVELGEDIVITGFGAGTENPLKGLEYATQNSLEQFEGLGARKLELINIGRGGVLAGDSGSPMLDVDGLIVAVTATGGSGVGVGAGGTRLYFARDFILDTIKGWHYPTLAKTTNGSVMIEVQSLHSASFMDNATTNGDVTITGGSCVAKIVEPFDICTYEISSANGYEGTLVLDDGESIVVNKGKAEPTPDSGGDSGGSMGWISLLVLAGVRKFGLSR
ncbi:MAG: trypsin-like serine protease [Oleispira sp.]|nr:trypsin-like serine protease [Oleispira sp.]